MDSVDGLSNERVLSRSQSMRNSVCNAVEVITAPGKASKKPHD